jgi:uracil-DNA glycosylase family 4
MVIYRGNPEAKLMIVGEAPGTQEDREGKPFVGRSGQLLDQILAAAGFDPEKDVFITNAVFRLPPGDDGKPLRKPTNEEIEFYKPYLLEIIRLVDPQIILLSGSRCWGKQGSPGCAGSGLTGTAVPPCPSSIPPICCATPRAKRTAPRR